MKPTRREEAETALYNAEKVLEQLVSKWTGQQGAHYQTIVRQEEVVRILRNLARPRSTVAAQ